jgi:hypothetical protein
LLHVFTAVNNRNIQIHNDATSTGRDRYIRSIQTFVCPIGTVANTCNTWNGSPLALLMLQHCRFTVVNFMYFRILMSNILIISVKAT